MSVTRARCTPGRLPSSLLIPVLLIILFPVASSAAPPEVAGLDFEATEMLGWGFVSGARGYHVYRTTRARLVSGDYGDCLVGSHRTTSLAVPDAPAPGEVHLVLVTAFDETGEGTAGFRSDGGERPPPNPCVPARRHFGFAVNGDPGDGIPDGVAPARNPAAAPYTIGRDATGVLLHSGEFFLSALDLESRGKLEHYDWPGSYAARFDGVGPTGGGPGNLAVESPSLFAAIAIPNLIEARKGSNEAAPIGALRTPGPARAMLPEGDKDGAGLAYGTRVPDLISLLAAIAVPNLIESRKSSNDAGGSEVPSRGSADFASTGSAASTLVLAPGLVPSAWDCGAIWDQCQYYLEHELCPEYYACYDSYVECQDAKYQAGVGNSSICGKVDDLFQAPILKVPGSLGAGVGARLDGGGMQGALLRTYRSQVAYDGPLGHGWELGANTRLAAEGGDVRVHDGGGRADLFARTSPTTFASPAGIYALLVNNPDGSFTLRTPDGTERDFHAFDGTGLEGAIERIADRNGNRTSFLYDHQGLLTTVVDTLGRSVDLDYDGAGRIVSMTDFAGRQVRYSYDAAGNLVSVRTPVVTGTPNGNDFPSGKVTTYLYSAGMADGRLDHNLTGIVRPDQAGAALPVVQIAYGSGAGTFDFDRVTVAIIGGTDAGGVSAGGSLSYSYEPLNAGAPPDPVTPRRRTTVVDRNGNLKEFVHNAAGNLLSRTDFTNRDLRPGEPDHTTAFAYDDEGELVEAILPMGNRARMVYDRASPNRGSHGNLLEFRLVADPPGEGGGRGDGRGGAIANRVWTFTYEPVFNRPLSMTDPRGNDPSYVPQNGGAQSPGRYTLHWTYEFQEGDPATNGIGALAARFGIDLDGLPFNLGDLNGDGIAASPLLNQIIQAELFQIPLDPGSNQAQIDDNLVQENVFHYEWNRFGQPIAVTDAEGNRHEFEYHPETDPDGDGVDEPPPDDGRVLDRSTGGYLKTARLDTTAGPGRNNGTDPDPTDIRRDFQYDDVGNVTGIVDGRGVLTRLVVNALDQVVEVRRAAATADAGGPDGDPPTGRGEPGLAAFGFRTRYTYDANDNLVQVAVEDRGGTRGVGPFVETTRTYDLLGNMLSVSREATPARSLVTRFAYDANENLIRVTQPAGNSHEWSWDERDLLLARTTGASGPRGGAPAITRHDYDPNGGLVRVVDPLGGPVDLLRDGFDRAVRSIDQTGTTADRFHDPISRPVRVLRRGPVGGTAPPDRSGATNVDLADARLLYDEAGRLFRADRSLFVPIGATPARPPILADGPLVPGDGAVNTVYEYDRLSRLTFVVRDSGATTRHDYDGAGRTVRATLPAGSETWRIAWDDAGNLIETSETERSSTGAAGPPPETFLTTLLHDALGRPVMVVDNVGQTSRAVYDSLGAVVAASDPRGPAGGTILRRSPGNESTSVPVNGHGNVVNHAFDGAGRRLSTERVLTADGEGDGTLQPPPDDDNVFNPDGLIATTTVWDDNSLSSASIDDRGNITSYTYDNLNRLVTRTGDDETMHRYAYDARGNLVSLTDPNDSRFTYSHDAAHRLTGIGVAAGSGVVATAGRTFEYDGLGRVTRATDGNALPEPDDEVLVGFVHDSLSRLVEEIRSPATGAPPLATDYGWRADDQMTDLIYPDGRRIRYEYDGAGRLVLVDDLDDARPEQVAYQYFGLDRIHTRSNAAGIRSTRLNDAGDAAAGFDGARRTTLLRHLGSAGTLLAGYEYRYDRQASPSSQRRLHHAGAGGATLKGEQYGYDSSRRLITFREGFLDADHLLGPPPDDSIDWLLDGTSNWNRMTRNGMTYLATPNNMNDYGEPQSGGTATDDGVPDDFQDDAATPAPDGLNLANDPNGNLTFDGRHILHFDAFDRLVRAVRASDGAEVAAYTYDAFGRRARRVVSNSGPLDASRDYGYSWWFQGNAGVIEEREADGTVARQVVPGPEGALWQVLAGGPAHYVLEDASGSAAALFLAGARGGIVERVTYDPHGKPQFESAANVPFVDADGSFLPQSQYGNTGLFHGMSYEPELGDRADDVNDDWGGLYAIGSGWQIYSGRNSLYVAQDSRWWWLPDPSRRIGPERIGSDWTYLPVGRFAAYLESSLFGGLEWAVFGPGGGPGKETIPSPDAGFSADIAPLSHSPLVFSFPQGGLKGGLPPSNDFPVESLSLNYGGIEWTYTKQGGGHGGKPGAPSYDLGGRYDPNKGRSISAKRCEGPCP